MEDKIREYESLLNEKAALEKECIDLSLDYSREFGEDIILLFELKVVVVTLKKKIAYCVKKAYNDEKILSNDLSRYIDDEIMDYQRKLQELIAFNQAAKEGGEPITFEEGRKIKKLYYKIAHLIHPDLHPEYNGNEKIEALWLKALNAYKLNDYKAITEAYDQIIILVSESDIVIEDIDNKIKGLYDEIKEIKENEPYTYKFILDDLDQVEEYHEELQKEIKDYKEYKASLEIELSKFDIINGAEA